MATWLSIVNDLQTRLRETSSVTVDTTTYSSLLGNLVNQAKAIVEDAWDWHCLRTILSFNTSSGTASYTITGSNERSRFFTPTREIYNDTNDGIIYPAPDWFIDQQTYMGTTDNGLPSFYRIRGISSGELQITFFPTPGGTYTMRIPMVVPQSDLAADATVLTVPVSPVRERAYVLALRERGEDGGTAFAEADKFANDVLFQSVMRDMEFNPDEANAVLA